MTLRRIIANEREAREVRSRIDRLTEAMRSSTAFERVAQGLPPEVTTQLAAMMRAERQRLKTMLDAYERARDTGKATELVEMANHEPGLVLVVARIAKGYSQRELAWRLGVKEQQVQRYEAELYGQISLRNYERVAALLGVSLRAELQERPELRGLDHVIDDLSRAEIKTILKHGRANGWFQGEMSEAELRRYIAENRIDFGSPSLLRTGLNIVDHSEDVLLHAWRARVAELARGGARGELGSFDPADVGWLRELVALSRFDDGPVRAIELLRRKGVAVICEPQITGLKIDGAAFVVDGVPVIALTLRHDRLDNFWFTLLHELAHVLLHHATGLSVGFYDDTEAASVDEQEAQADRFAQNLLIGEEAWYRSPARISRKETIIERFADEIGVHPAIVYGRIRKERNNYTLFDKKIGRNAVRNQLLGEPQKG